MQQNQHVASKAITRQRRSNRCSNTVATLAGVLKITSSTNDRGTPQDQLTQVPLTFILYSTQNATTLARRIRQLPTYSILTQPQVKLYFYLYSTE
jgi:hypothetical protein